MMNGNEMRKPYGEMNAIAKPSFNLWRGRVQAASMIDYGVLLCKHFKVTDAEPSNSTV